MIKLFKKWVEPKPRRERKPNESCLNCCYFDHCDPEDVDGTDGYCCNGIGHAEYGGHWTNSKEWCELWESADELRRAIIKIREEK